LNLMLMKNTLGVSVTIRLGLGLSEILSEVR